MGCSPSAFISKQAKNNLLHSSELENAHVGISIYDATANKSIYQYQSNKYFVPASNTKLFSCYAALKHLGDSLPGIYYKENDTAVFIIPAGDPTLLHKDFTQQPVIKFLQSTNKKIYITDQNWKENALGFGWSWDDYNSDYMAERSPLPVYGNVVKWVQERDTTQKNEGGQFNNPVSIYSIPEINWRVRFNPDSASPAFFVKRNRDDNVFVISEGKEVKKEQDVPFVTNGLSSAVELMKDTIGKEVGILHGTEIKLDNLTPIYSQPLDSFLKPMMYRSDNFFAEQALLMVSQQLLHAMSTSRLIDSLLKTDLKALPQKPRWVDGSGLSRYNLFTPDDIVWLLNKMKDEFGVERLKKILPTGGTGTLTNYFQTEAGLIFGKTGTLSGQVALSGILYTRNNRLLIFSLLVNNHNGSVVAIRRQTEAFIRALRDHY
jgi:D-alanyl-D-alanine carboxypeptidase/D-alanyl-D-alanine-endopeptidase (penicillin-binding protein 4)